MACSACTLAESTPDIDAFESGCLDCQARALAAIGAHLESLSGKVLTAQYRGALEKIFGDRWRDGHERVKAWGALIHAAKVRRAARPA